MKKIILALLFSTFATTVKAQDYSSGRILEIQLNRGGGIKVLQEDAFFPDECRAISRYWHVIERNNDIEQNFLAALLAAYQSGQSVDIKRVGSNICYEDRLPTVTEILLY